MYIIVVVLLLYLPDIVYPQAYQTIPLRFDIAINQLLQRHRYTHHEIDYEAYSITPAEMLELNLDSSNSNETTKCEQDFAILVKAALRRDLWALKIFDSWGKPLPSGLLKGNILWTGNYDECLDPLYQVPNKTFVHQPFDGQYCALSLSGTTSEGATSSGLTLGICVPESCDRQAIAILARSLFKKDNITENNLLCSNDAASKQKSLSRGAVATCVVLSLLGLLVVIGTIVDLLTSRLKSVTHVAPHINGYDCISSISSTGAKSIVVPGYSRFSIQTLVDAIPRSVFIAQFSAIRTSRRIFTMTKNDDENSLAFIHGLRVLSLFWVILGHSILFNLFYTSNPVDVLSWSHNMAFQFITSGILSVDTFFVLSGFLTTIIFVRAVTKEKFSLRFFILYYVHRYIRLTPTFLLIILVSINLTPFFGRGPIFPVVQGFESDGCRHRGWWTDIFYIGNLVHSDDMCLGISWYLHNDMQFHWIAPLALIPFVIGRKPIGYVVAILFVLVSMGSILGIFLYYPSMSLNLLTDATNIDGPSFFSKVYITPWCRISAYAIGLLTGFIVINVGRSYHSNTCTKLFGTFLAIVVGLTCVFVMYLDYVLVPGLSRSALIAYQILSRPCWALVIGWILFLCSTNQGGIVNTILSWPIWAPLARLNYSAYLIHLTVLLTTIYNHTMPIYNQPYMVLNTYVSNIFFTYVTAIVVVIFFETPFFIFEKYLFKR
ncbi:unnamed protein product [Rotaria magnacalcarata]|uniref:Nose resistant-to-fluoxetine protein N-terminal domain-containing protein n=1 Tax=Rotaria magnacalcarata TaxID=392030 RepID=A0A816G412_9BILA|nr:unnamed protein product [Rotaria magnacalcarata]CAF1669383.1 unnamed protein product [Rotaria magnacalcarata]CAF1926951.1 unnamed protein product [Rotaria magnacalcarata]CAF3956532.1 unnamed protein product [Rotaria magnacalcarata]CAF4024034.1 unnamed protein product [Rotaria magnacalcarata]